VRPSTALVLETDNLVAIDAQAEAVVSGLERLLVRLADTSTPRSQADEVIVTHEGLVPRDQARLVRAAGRPLRFVEVPEGGGYYDAKNRGFAATTAEVVAFGDGDCWPEPRWLEALIQPFVDPEVGVVAGRTVYAPSALGDALTAIDFEPVPSPLGRGCVRHFLANNVAFRRDVFASRLFEPRADLHRGACGVLALRLHRERVRILLAPDALTTHRTPHGTAELVDRRMKRGSDLARLAPDIARTHLPPSLAWIGALGPVSPMVLLGGRLVTAAAALARRRRRHASSQAPTATIASIALAVTALDAWGALASR
jgi:glycosyltransferase involved in cell wall biosynthesis